MLIEQVPGDGEGGKTRSSCILWAMKGIRNHSEYKVKASRGLSREGEDSIHT